MDDEKHRCHGGFDSLVTSRETYEIATRFFTGNVKARLRLVDGKIKRGFDERDLFGIGFSDNDQAAPQPAKQVRRQTEHEPP